jgi:CRISPR-associated protein (TIGR03984 family)
MKLKILKLKNESLPISVPIDFGGNIKAWFEEQAKYHDLKWLLVHADDGVIWGEFRDGKIHLSSKLFGPELRLKTLQMARLFGATGELFIWRNDYCSWKARLVIDKEGQEIECFDEIMLLLGTRWKNSNDGFFLWEHGSEGLRHAPPIDINDDLKLKVRHYINYDEDGQAYIKFSRLVCIGADIRKEVV